MTERIGFEVYACPIHRTEDGQWFTSGYVFKDRLVHHFYIDRKEQHDGAWWRKTPEAFLEGSASEEAKAWLRALLEAG